MSNTIDTLFQIIEDAQKRDLAHNYTDEHPMAGDGTVVVSGQRLANFGACSYLGLEHEPCMKQGVVDAVGRYGTQFSSSRTYLSLGLYQRVEEALRQIFGQPLVVAASTTLGHLAAIPAIVADGDAVVVDLQAHASMQMAIQLLKARKVPIHTVKHNDMDALGQKINQLGNAHDKVWYFADGVYSMYGDYAPFAELETLLDKHKKFHLYIDDAHGVGWAGEHGRGVVRRHMAHHPKMVLAVSLNKSFAAAGGCIVFPNEDMAQRVRHCGGTYIFCGPIQPPMLGAVLASAQWHLSAALPGRQAALAALVAHTNTRLAKLGLPQYRETDSPLFFIPVGLPKIAYDIVKGMRKDGFYLNTAAFPAVPMKKSGIRFMVNTQANIATVDAMLGKLQAHYYRALAQAGSSAGEVSRQFGIPAFGVPEARRDTRLAANGSGLRLALHRSANGICRHQWNRCFGGQGNLDYDNICLLEKTFANQALPENNWGFYYVDITDAQGHTVLKTFYTTAMAKDDMLSPAHVSQQVETARQTDPYYLTSKYVVSGTWLTKGRHVWLDFGHRQWRAALGMLVAQMGKTMEEAKATKLMLRDFYGCQGPELDTAMLALGLARCQMPNNMLVRRLDWQSNEEYMARLGQKYRYNVRREILAHAHKFVIDPHKPTTEGALQACYALYGQVFGKSYALNVFKLPYHAYKAMCGHANYDVLNLYLKPHYAEGHAGAQPVLVGTMLSYINDGVYNALVVGLDYRHAHTHNVYKQLLYQTLVRARQLGCATLDLAFTAELEKKKIGARPQAVHAYAQATEHYQHSVLETMR